MAICFSGNFLSQRGKCSYQPHNRVGNHGHRNHPKEQIECSTIFISYIERGEKSPSLDTLVKLANALDISVDILFGKELKNYTSEKLKYIESQLKNLPSLEQQKVLDIMDSVVAVELSYHNEKGLQKKC